MKDLKSFGKIFLCLLFFIVLCVTIMLITNVAFNNNSSYFDRHINFSYNSNYGEQL